MDFALFMRADSSWFMVCGNRTLAPAKVRFPQTKNHDESARVNKAKFADFPVPGAGKRRMSPCLCERIHHGFWFVGIVPWRVRFEYRDFYYGADHWRARSKDFPITARFTP